MALERQLERWRGAGLIDAEQVERIRRFEAGQSRPTFLRAAAAVAGVSIAIGLVSIIAANWDAIPARVKISIDLALLAALSYAVSYRPRLGPSWLRESGLVVLYGFVLASIALVGQVYQLGGNAPAALCAWSVLTFPALAQGRSAALGWIWSLGLQASYVVVWSKLAERRPDYEALTLSALYCAPLAWIALGRSAWLERRRPAYARVACALGWGELVLAGSVASLAFYASELSFAASRARWLGAAVCALGTAWLWYRESAGAAPNARRWLLFGALFAVQLPLLLPHGRWELVGFLSFLALWSLVVLAAYRAGARQLLNAASAVIGLRLLVGYVEVFGSLLETGVGLVLGGVLALILLWLWARQRRSWDARLGPPGVPVVPSAPEDGA